MFKVPLEQIMLRPLPMNDHAGRTSAGVTVGVTVGVILLANSAAAAPPSVPAPLARPAASSVALDLPPMPLRILAGELDLPTEKSAPGGLPPLPGQAADPPARPAIAATAVPADPAVAEKTEGSTQKRRGGKKAAAGSKISKPTTIAGRQLDSEGRMIFDVESRDRLVSAALHGNGSAETYVPVAQAPAPAARPSRAPASAQSRLPEYEVGQWPKSPTAQPAQPPVGIAADSKDGSNMKDPNAYDGGHSVPGRRGQAAEYASLSSGSDLPAPTHNPNAYTGGHAVPSRPMQISPTSVPESPAEAASRQGLDASSTSTAAALPMAPESAALQPTPVVVKSINDLKNALLEDPRRNVLLTGSASAGQVGREAALQLAASRGIELKRELIEKGVPEARIRVAPPVIGADGVSFKICGAACS